MVRRPAAMSPPKSRSYKAAEKAKAYYAVCLIGFEDGRVPRYMGDNHGTVPVMIVIAKKERDAPKKYDAGQAIHRIVVLESLHVPSEEHAKRLKLALDQALMGDSARRGNDAMRRSWRDASGLFEGELDRQIWWGVMLEHALRGVSKQARTFEVFSGAERIERTKKAAYAGRGAR